MINQDSDWRETVPGRLRGFTDLISVSEIAQIFDFSAVYVRKLRQARVLADARGDMGDAINALPRDSGVSKHPFLWRTSEIVTWGMQTGRLHPDTGEPQRLVGIGQPPKSARSRT